MVVDLSGRFHLRTLDRQSVLTPGMYQSFYLTCPRCFWSRTVVITHNLLGNLDRLGPIMIGISQEI